MLSVERSISTPHQGTLRSTHRVTARPNWAQIGLVALLLGMGFYVIYPLLLGMNRGRYFLMTGQTLDAAEALRLGLVAEVLPPDKLMARAWELAEDLTRKPTLLLRYTRLLFTEYLRRQMHDLLGYGLAMESLALFEKPEAPAAKS